MNSETVLLFSEDFSTYPVGVIAGNYTPVGEYHVVPSMADSGRWRETVVHYSYRLSSGNWQVVPEVDGAQVLEETFGIEQYEAMLATSAETWRDVTLEAGIRPLTNAGWRAIVFRYRHARRFYAAAFHGDKVSVFRRDNDRDTILGEAACTLNPDCYARVRIECNGAKIGVAVDGKALLSCADTASEAFLTGSVAFAARTPTRFRDLRVTAPLASAQESLKEKKADETAIQRVQAAHPKAKLWKKIPTPRFGTDRNLRMGDIDGDGQPEIVLARRTQLYGRDDFTRICGLAAYKLGGELMWMYGTPSAFKTHTSGDLCFQVHDLDGDGRADVYFTRDDQFCMADGRSGKVATLMQMPAWPADSKWARGLHRVLGDSIFFCDLAGTGRPDSIIVKDRYLHSWAFDKKLRPLWNFDGNLGHYPFARDIDGDGKDEVMFGYHLLDHDGSVKWSVKYLEHADNAAIVDLCSSVTGRREPHVVLAASDAGFVILDLEGREKVHYPIGHAQSYCIGKVLADVPGLQIVCNTYWGAAGITATFDETGKLLHECEPMPYACLLQPVNWVPLNGDGTAADLLLLSTHPRQGGLIDGYGRRAVMFPDDGHPVLCNDARDVDGDGIDEVLTWDEHEIWIYKADRVPGRTPANYPKRNAWYNDSNYRAQISLPRG